MVKKKVQVFVVGQPKSGTTALTHFLGQHPGVTIAQPKEPHYFCTDLARESDAFHGRDAGFFPTRTDEQYAACFAGADDDQILVDASTHYVLSQEAARNIHAYNPSAKIIIMLREPVAFLHSLHQQYVNSAWETEADFTTALRLEQDRKSGKQIPRNTCTPSFLHYCERVRYADQIIRFTEAFGSNVLTIIHEEFSNRNEAYFDRVIDFIGAEAGHTPEFSRVHERKAPRNRFVHSLLNTPLLKNSVRGLLSPQTYDRLKQSAAAILLQRQEAPKIEPGLSERLHGDFREHVLATAQAINRKDLPSLWGYDE